MTLTALVMLPLAGALLVMVGSSAWPRLAPRWTALGTAIALSGLTAWVVAEGTAGGLSEAVGVEGALFWRLSLDGLSAPLVALAGMLSVVAILASWRIRDASHHALLLGLMAAVYAVFLAADLITFYVAWEAVLIPMYFLIGIWGHEGRRHAAMKFFLYTFAGSVLMFAGLLVAMIQTEASSFERVFEAGLPPGTQTLVFWLLAAGFLVKVPVFGLHTWLPDAHVEAPTAGSILLAGVLLKMGPYALLRVGLPLAPAAFEAARPVLAALGVIGIVYGAAVAFAQSDLKRLVAYSSIAHMGFVVLAVAAATPLALAGAMIGMVSHGLVAGLLFLLVGVLYDRTHTREIARFGGLGGTLPKWAALFTFGALASAGLPGLSGFPGEFVAIIEAFGAFGWWGAVAALGAVLAAAYNLNAVRRVCHGAGPSEPLDLGAGDMTHSEMAAAALLCVGVLAIGVWPGLVTAAGAGTLQRIAGLVTGAS